MQDMELGKEDLLLTQELESLTIFSPGSLRKFLNLYLTQKGKKMSNYNSLKSTIDANIKQNENQEITGQILNSVLNAMVTTLGTGYQFAGVATTATNPGSPDAKVFYIANGKGKYEKFGGLEVTEDEVVVLYWDSAWHKVATGIASQEKLSELEGKTNALELKNTEEQGFYICDHEGNVLIRLDILDTKGGIGNNLANSIKTLVQNVGAEGFTKIESNEIGEKLKAAVKLEAGHQSTI